LHLLEKERCFLITDLYYGSLASLSRKQQPSTVLRLAVRLAKRAIVLSRGRPGGDEDESRHSNRNDPVLSKCEFLASYPFGSLSGVMSSQRCYLSITYRSTIRKALRKLSPESPLRSYFNTTCQYSASNRDISQERYLCKKYVCQAKSHLVNSRFVVATIGSVVHDTRSEAALFLGSVNESV
jgi:hypothetical protein